MAPTLGFEAPREYLPGEIALLQLNEAIALFVNRKFLPAVTLAAAAEEILGKLVGQHGGTAAVKEAASSIALLRVQLGVGAMQGKSEKSMIDEWNSARNSLKHLTTEHDEPITLNACDEAYWMIRRALANARSLALPVEMTQELENWIIINVTT
jgi:hypothetical protein